MRTAILSVAVAALFAGACAPAAGSSALPPSLCGLAEQPADAPATAILLVEIPRGGREKLEFDAVTRQMQVDRVLPDSLAYPAAYGAFPCSLAGDADPLDALLFGDSTAQSGDRVLVRPVGVLRMTDAGQQDDKIIVVPVASTLDSVPALFRARVEAFFQAYKGPASRVQLHGWEDGDEARDILATALRSARALSVGGDSVAIVAEAWVGPIDTLDNVDGPAIWFSDDGPRIIASAKATDVLIVYDAVTGAPIRRVGGPGAGRGQLARPNGVLVLGDSLLLVVERDNHRVQGFALPSFASLGSFGGTDLTLPYGLAAYAPRAGVYRVYVTDNYEEPEDEVPPLSRLDRRVRVYDIATRGGALTATLVNTFGDTTDAGAIRIAESIHLDPANDRVMIAEEDERRTEVKEYTLDGRFTGRTFGRGLLAQQAEGIALWTCGQRDGYWIVTDQGPLVNTFWLFDRQTLQPVGAFRGRVTNTTDGVALTQRAVGPYEAGMFFAAHFDATISAFSWRGVAEAVGVSARCGDAG
ncbi:MAG: inorganic diphosphatase [Gemmatimonadaceae bacterium]|nr:inorganic diphosphatase [Gemmatimonadaceae bacterium]MCW5825174.1 inorganic diphosphatase [Gemmatimonadaceae bacterium]